MSKVVLQRTAPGRYTTSHEGHTWHVARTRTAYGDEQYMIDRDDRPAYAQVGTLHEVRATIAAFRTIEKCHTCSGSREVEMCTSCDNVVDNCTCDGDSLPETEMRTCGECGGDGETETEE